MLDLDKYINNSIKVRIGGEVYDILEPTIKMNMEINKIESDIGEENLHEKRIETAKVFMDHNRQGRKFSKEELEEIPFEGLSMLLAEIALMHAKADSDPNSKSQSQTEK